MNSGEYKPADTPLIYEMPVTFRQTKFARKCVFSWPEWVVNGKSSKPACWAGEDFRTKNVAWWTQL